MNSPHKGQWRGALINGWVNYREAGDSRRHCAHYDVIEMLSLEHSCRLSFDTTWSNTTIAKPKHVPVLGGTAKVPHSLAINCSSHFRRHVAPTLCLVTSLVRSCCIHFLSQQSSTTEERCFSRDKGCHNNEVQRHHNALRFIYHVRSRSYWRLWRNQTTVILYTVAISAYIFRCEAE